MRFLKTNTAVIITVGPFYDATDGVTIEGSLTISNERITLTADTDAGSAPTNILDNVTGATSATDNDLNYITGNDAGMMQLELSAANVNRFGRMYLSITDAANHVPVFHEFMVLPAVIYDTFILGSDTFDVNVTSMAANVLTATAINADAITAAKIADNALANEHFAAGALTATEVTSVGGVSALQTDLDTLTDNRGHPAQGTPGTSVGMAEKVDWLYKFMINKKTATSTTISVFNSDESTVDHKSTISQSGGTYTEGEWATGP